VQSPIAEENLKSAFENLGNEDLDKIIAALGTLKPDDLNKLKSVVKSVGDTTQDKDPVAAAGKLTDEDLKYLSQTGLMDSLDGCFRCALKMKPLDVNKFAVDYFSGALEKQKRLVLISSDAPEPEQLMACVRPTGDMGAPIVTAIYDFNKDSAALIKQIQDLVAEHGAFKTMALCCHGKEEAIPEAENGGAALEDSKWKILNNCGVQIGGDAASDAGAEDILQAIADAVTVRVDLLSCSLVASEAGKAWLDAWEKKIGKNVAASTDVTGNTEKGGDWILESDGIDVAQVYFKKDDLDAYAGTFVRGPDRQGWTQDKDGMWCAPPARASLGISQEAARNRAREKMRERSAQMDRNIAAVRAAQR